MLARHVDGNWISDQTRQGEQPQRKWTLMRWYRDTTGRLEIRWEIDPETRRSTLVWMDGRPHRSEGS